MELGRSLDFHIRRSDKVTDRNDLNDCKCAAAMSPSPGAAKAG
jgi:hypothetical protein